MVHYTVTEISYFVKHNNQGEYHEKENFSQNITFRGSDDRINRMWRKEEQRELAQRLAIAREVRDDDQHVHIPPREASRQKKALRAILGAWRFKASPPRRLKSRFVWP